LSVRFSRRRRGIGEAIIVPGLIKTSDRTLKTNIGSHVDGRHDVVVMDGAGWHTEEIANDFKMSVSSNFHPILQS
ncbi:hypothetical protein O7R07_23445, partial [Vibrio parahaemolyticus]|nr:hypothetical protein [Vibrio parahaemolyticus]